MSERNPGASGWVAWPSPGDERDWLRMVLELQPLPSLVIDAETSRIVLSNEAARRVGLEPPDSGPRPGHHATDADGVRIVPEQFARQILPRATAPEGAEFLWHTPERAYRFCVHARRLPPSDGRAALAVLTFLDLTARVAAEAELRQALEVRDEFFSIATHELKDPLFSLQLSIQLLRHAATRQGEIPPYLAHHLEVGQRQTERLSRLIDNLLDVSRIMNRRLQLDIEALDLGELVRECAERFRERGVATRTPITVDAATPLIGYFDRLKIEQVITNLLSNALKYGAGKPVAVRVAGGDDDETAVVEVADQGPGIAAADQARIFGRFERASDGHKKESLGLGLYIVRSLVEAHGGSVVVRSEPGQGATFVVTLPRKRLPNDVAATSTSTSTSPADARGSTQG